MTGEPAPHSAGVTRPRSPLGEALELGRLRTGLSTAQFLRRHSITWGTWARLLQGPDRAQKKTTRTPNPGTVLRCALAAGLDEQTARSLMETTYPRRLTRWGELLEPRLQKRYPTLRAYLTANNVPRMNWWRLVRDPGSEQDLLTVVKLAAPLGMGVEAVLAEAQAQRLHTDGLTPPLTDLGLRLERRRLELGLSVVEVRDLPGCTLQTWERLLYCAGTYRYSTVVRHAEVLGLRVEDLGVKILCDQHGSPASVESTVPAGDAPRG